mmetsp:Transcript_23575/g.22721  ORF Transcript_23575/g.22721 Transcript_23575/m.22721 type:complete len:188 (-) Transcript_23575:149-712(-)
MHNLDRHSAKSEKKDSLNVSRGLKHSGKVEDLRRNILIVDDSGLSRKMLCRLLCTTGCVFDEAEDGLIAIDKVKTKMSFTTKESHQDSYNVILMDYVMPNMDGPTATKAIRAAGYTAPIFGLTGNALDSDIDYFLSCGANEVMTKPFDLSLFEGIIKKYDEEVRRSSLFSPSTDTIPEDRSVTSYFK